LKANKLGTDKNHLHSYINEIYEPIFSVIEAPKSILEIGVQHKASLALWKILFKNASVTGWDIDILQPTHPTAKKLIEAGEIFLVQKDAYKFLGEVPTGLTIVIDDGPHTLNSQIIALEFRHKLDSEGVLIIEDVGEYGGPQYCFYRLLRSMPSNERKFCLNIDLSEKKGRWDDAVFIYSKNNFVLEALKSRHQNYIRSYRQLMIYALVWKVKRNIKSLISLSQRA